MKGIISMSVKEVDRISVMEALVGKRVKQRQAATQLQLSIRQVKRLLKRYRILGVGGLVHQGRGHPSHRAIPEEERKRIAAIVGDRYPDFGPTFALEKLQECHGITISDETLRTIMIDHHLWVPKQRKLQELHPYRERRACFGELIQLDGSPHAWFEERAPACTLLAYIDDATSSLLYGEFVEHEGTFPLFKATEHYLKRYGKPVVFYVDRHSTFKVNRQATIEEELRDTQAPSQFGRSMADLKITVIFARSPEAKGRVERLFATLQDRLVKELRLTGISDQGEATRYLNEVYLPKHNAKFAVPPREKGNLHRPLLKSDDLARIFTIRSNRLVSKDQIVQYKNTRYQLKPPAGYSYSLRKAVVTVEENEKGELRFRYKEKQIPYEEAVQRIRREDLVQVVGRKEFQERRVYIPGPDHPWKRSYYARF